MPVNKKNPFPHGHNLRHNPNHQYNRVKVDAKLDKKADQQAADPKRGAGSAEGRAVAPDPNKPTSKDNQDEIKKLQKDKTYKKNTVRIHFKGERDKNDKTPGTRLIGKPADRKSPDQYQSAIRDYHSDKFIKQGHATGNNGSKEWAAEVNHARARHAGGHSDYLGMQPGSFHSNTEDAAREGAHKTLHKNLHPDPKLDDNARIKSTIYVHSSGPNQGTIKAARHKIYVKNEKGEWKKKSDHLQNGHRGNIDKNEVAALKEQIANLDSKSPNVRLHTDKEVRGIDPTSTVSDQVTFSPKGKDQKTANSKYFTDLTFKIGKAKRRLMGDAAAEKMKKITEDAAKEIWKKKGLIKG